MMVLVLFLLAAVMMVSGAAAMFFGSDIIMVERGWAMVIAGATGFSAGAVLLGIATLLRTLERIAQEVGTERGPAMSRDGAVVSPRVEPAAKRAVPVTLPGSVAAEPQMQPESVRPEPPPLEPRRGEPLATPASPPIEEVRPADRREERLPEPPEPQVEPEPRPNGAHPLAQSDILVAPDPPRIRLVESEVEPRFELPRPDETVRVPESLRRAERPRGPEPLRVPEPPRRAEPPPEPQPEITVVGKYSSGGNSYVMFSDGSIQADTPSGRHRFASLDELKVFVASGGERR
jgi:hypothetical protein